MACPMVNAAIDKNKLDSLILSSDNVTLSDTQRANILLSVYLTYMYAEQFVTGKPYLDKALQLALSSGDPIAVADVKSMLGQYYLVADNHPEALRLHTQSLEIYELKGESEKAINSLKYIGLIYHEENNFELAVSYYNEAIGKSLKVNSMVQASTCSYLKALSLTEVGKLEQSASILNSILAQPDSVSNKQRKTECMVAIGDIFMKRNRYDSAAYYYDYGYVNFGKDNNIAGVVHAGFGLAKVYTKLNKVDDAIAIAIRCFNLSSTIQSSLKDKLIGYRVVSDAYFQKNDFRNAYLYLNRYYALRDTIYSAESERKINDLRLASKQQEVDIANKNRQKQAILKNAFIIGFMLVLLLLVVSIRSITVNRRKNNELKQSNYELGQTLNQLRATQEQLIKQEKLASLGQLVAGIAHEMQNPLNFVNNFSEVSVQLAKEYAKADTEERPELMREIEENLIRIRDHGIRASAIVRSMLLYSRNSTFEKQYIDIHSVLNDFIPLAYEGLHATDSSFNCRIEKKFSILPQVLCVPQDISRVFLNLLTNAFYAVNDKKKTSNEYFLPIVTVSTSVVGKSVKISIQDNGNGIPDNVKDKIFEPFFTTKPAGKGTGLGLSLSYDVVKAHGGSLTVESKLGVFTEFNITLPES